MNAPFNPPADLDVAIIGAGFSGLCMAIHLKKAGYKSFTIFEKAGDLGGTWRDNRYPGCACDVPSHLYSFSFEQNPDWSRSFSPQAEIWRYMKDCAGKHGILPHMRFNAAVASAAYDESAQLWRLRLKDGETVTARAVVSGIGALHLPAFPKIKGLETFAGRAFHSSDWDESYDLAGKRVAVIGTGASAIQIVPNIAGKVKELSLFQRTPSWIVPRMDRAFSDKTKSRFRRFPRLQRALRHVIYLALESRALGFISRPGMLKAGEKMARDYIARSIPDPAMRQKLTPDYAMGCKRILISDDFYGALTRPNVELVTDAIREVTPQGIVTEDGKLREFDALVYATGFRATEVLAEMRVTGRGGRQLADDWKDGAQAYYGIAVSGYPNFFMLLGPNTGLGHNSIIFMIEAQTRYIMDCLRWLRGGGEVDVREDVQRDFNATLRTKMERTVWKSGCRSWYLNENGSNSVIWPGFTVDYWWKTRHARRADFTVRPAKVAA
ncbi:MAG TPA: NAD(P)/FAD-dependent oxidoreductase [Rhizomicrobium sp.]|nr:NAD(P)/FAD-dependent oxidoreductase [Rhizomicrobium sp.]